jgi:hypothetical protein
MKVSKNLSANFELRKSVNVNWPSTLGLMRSLLFVYWSINMAYLLYGVM